MMEATKVFVLFLGFICFASASKKCTDVSGHWQNELGSRMFLNGDGNSRLRGNYETAVESESGAAAFASNVTGIFANRKDGLLLAFSVLFNHGSSLATWVGQCLVCEEREVLHTTYVLRSYVSDPKQKWKAVIVNQNTFWRWEKEQEHDVVRRLSLNSNSSVEPPPTHKALNVGGKWISNGKEEIEIFGENGNFTEDNSHIIGKWMSNNKNEEIEVYGVIDFLDGKYNSAYLTEENGGEKFTAVAIMAASDKRVRSWAGHVSEDLSISSKTLETAWLEHEFNPSCLTPRSIVQFGMTNFSRAATVDELSLKKSETFLEKIRKFFSSMF